MDVSSEQCDHFSWTTAARAASDLLGLHGPAGVCVHCGADMTCPVHMGQSAPVAVLQTYTRRAAASSGEMPTRMLYQRLPQARDAHQAGDAWDCRRLVADTTATGSRTALWGWEGHGGGRNNNESSGTRRQAADAGQPLRKWRVWKRRDRDDAPGHWHAAAAASLTVLPLGRAKAITSVESLPCCGAPRRGRRRGAQPAAPQRLRVGLRLPVDRERDGSESEPSVPASRTRAGRHGSGWVKDAASHTCQVQPHCRDALC